MPAAHLRTSDIANDLGVHVNTVRLYEAQGFIAPVPRGTNGYRYYEPIHLEQARLAHLTLHWPYLGDKKQLIQLVQHAVAGAWETAMQLAHEYLILIQREKASAEATLDFLEQWAKGQLVESPSQLMPIGEAALYLDASADMLRNWERNGLITVPRDPSNGYRLYGGAELGRLRVIRMLIRSGFSLMAILKMLTQFDEGKRENLRQALNLPLEESMNEYILVIADRWLISLLELEERAQAIIRQVVSLMYLTRQSSSGGG